MDIRSDNGAHTGISGDAAQSITKTTTNTYEGRGITAHEVWLAFRQFQKECEDDKKEMRAEFDKRVENIEEKVKNMKNTSIVGVLLVIIASIAYSLIQPSLGEQRYRVNALSQHEMYELSNQGNPTPPTFDIPAFPIDQNKKEEHCALLAINDLELSDLPEPVCFTTFDEALSYISKQTGYNVSDIRLLIETSKNSESEGRQLSQQTQVVIGAWFSLSGYNGSSTVVYSSNGNGCYDGSTWSVPVIQQYIASALKMGGCWTNTIHSEYYFHPSSAIQWCNCPSVALSQVQSAKYSP